MKIKYQIKDNKVRIGLEVTIQKNPDYWNSGADGLNPLKRPFPLIGIISAIGEDVGTYPVNIEVDGINYGFDSSTLKENGYIV